MLPHGGDSRTVHVVDDSSETIFSLSRGIDFTTLGKTAVLAYLNGVQLTKDLDYTITTNGFLELIIPVKAQDVLEVYEYESTDGCWISIPTKLGLYPSMNPNVYLDDTYIESTESNGSQNLRKR